jgi:hypothetical protein
MNYYTDSQATLDLLSQQRTANIIAFAILLIVFLSVLRSILRLGKEELPGKRLKPAKKRFMELEKDYKWRRLKVIYLMIGVLSIFIVIGMSYGQDERAALQTLDEFELERAEARFETIGNALVTVLILWAVYRFSMPGFYERLKNFRAYLSPPADKHSKNEG